MDPSDIGFWENQFEIFTILNHLYYDVLFILLKSKGAVQKTTPLQPTKKIWNQNFYIVYKPCVSSVWMGDQSLRLIFGVAFIVNG